MCGDCGECSPRPLSPRRHLSWAHSLRPPTPCARLRDAARSAAAAGSREGWARSGRRVLCFAAAAVAGERWAGSQDPERGGRAAGAQRAETPAGPGAGEGGPGGRMGQAAGSGSQNRSRARRRVLEAGRPGWGTGTLEQEARPGRVGSGDCRPRGGSRMEEVRVKGAPRAGGERCRL